MIALRSLALIFIMLTTALVCGAQKTETNYNVSFKGDKVGIVKVVEEIDKTKSTRTVRDLRTNTDAKIFSFLVHVESEVKIVKENDVLIEGTAYRHSNRGSNEVHAHVKRLNEKTYQKERNEIKASFDNSGITFCVVDLYFKEPRQIKTVFSNMYADYLNVKDLGKGRYEIAAPDNKKSFYSYLNGKLMRIEADTPLGAVIISRL